MSYKCLPGLDIHWVRVRKATHTCGSVRNAGKLHGTLRDWKCEGKALDSERKSGSEILLVLSVNTSIIY